MTDKSGDIACQPERNACQPELVSGSIEMLKRDAETSSV